MVYSVKARGRSRASRMMSGLLPIQVGCNMMVDFFQYRSDGVMLPEAMLIEVRLDDRIYLIIIWSLKDTLFIFRLHSAESS